MVLFTPLPLSRITFRLYWAWAATGAESRNAAARPATTRFIAVTSEETVWDDSSTLGCGLSLMWPAQVEDDADPVSCARRGKVGKLGRRGRGSRPPVG